MEDEYCNSLEGVGDGKDDSNPGEAGVEVEESREPADAKNTDQRHAALHLCDNLCLDFYKKGQPLASLRHTTSIQNL